LNCIFFDEHKVSEIKICPLLFLLRCRLLWETNLPNDELNFKDVTMEQAVLKMNPPTHSNKIQKLTAVDIGKQYVESLK
jgi:hypothetical protein